MGEIACTYIGGAGGKPLPGALVVDDTGVAFRIRKRVLKHFPWEQVRRLSFDDPGRTKSNVGALVVFGALAIGARKTFTMVTLSTDEGDTFYESKVPVAQWRSVARRIPEEVPPAAGKVYLDGTAVDGVAEAGGDPVDQIRRLAELRDAGILTVEEFEGKKADLLGRL